MELVSKSYKNYILLTETIGLVKDINEDTSGFEISEQSEVLCIADGHWGSEAAFYCKEKILKNQFPSTKKEARSLVKKIEKDLFKLYGANKMDPEKDFTPETSFVAIEKNKNLLSIMSYGDCRALVIRDQKIIFELKTIPTWLGAFSYLGLRNRVPVDESLVFEKIRTHSGDIVMIFSDGVDECKYETKTISFEWLAKQANDRHDLEIIMKKIFSEIEMNGAEDNAALGLIRIN